MRRKLPAGKDLKSAQHHWWPRSLSRFWADSAGGVHRISRDGTVTRSQPASFGAVTNAHHIKLGDAGAPTPWDETFEPQFGEADAAFPDLVLWMQGLDRIQPPDTLSLAERISPVAVTDEQFKTCIKCLVSLVVRSPRFRALIRQTTEEYRKEFGMNDYEARDSLIGLNQRGAFDLFFNGIAGRGKIAVLMSNGPELIFGDGFFHNFTSSADAPSHPKMLVPLTPQISVFYARPLSYPSEPRMTTISVVPDEIEFLNDTVQIYSQSELFFRTQKPDLIDEFKHGSLLEYEHNGHPWIDRLEQTVTGTPFA